MLIKPLGEYKPPRHALDEEDDSVQPLPKPSIVIDLNDDIKSIDYIIIAPSTLSSLPDSFGSEKSVGSIAIKYDLADLVPPKASDDEVVDDDEDYNIIEQLYSANKINKFETSSLDPIDIKFHQVENHSIISIVIPRYSNIITFNLLGKAIVEKLALIVKHDWILLTPCSLNNGSTISKLELSSKKEEKDDAHKLILDSIPNLKPPHFITGIAASVLSQLNILETKSVLTLVVDSEGHSGFEKSNSDAVVDAAFVVGSILLSSPDDYMLNVSKKVRKLNGFSNSGMYI
ncbi:hypothetical protein DFJ63DRAFT_315059 [Scheffersomyces coipomensis]|uniref:uncharacterized protein n=1 Tax=Scheffersomyces coipomensis TaxID=1788519 RepID=UPI00315C781D